MPRAIKLAPSILTADFARIGEQVQEAEAAGADYIHVDVMDGQFVPNITLGPLVVSAIHKATRLPLDVHLMILEPERQLEAFADAGASILTVHAEATRHLHRAVQMARRTGARAGVAINPATPAVMLDDILADVDLALVMSVNPGWGGQDFLHVVLHKLRQVRKMLDERTLPAELEVDGGLNLETAPLVVEAGATVVVAGSAIYNDRETVGSACGRMLQVIRGAQRAD
ncbi:MAG TPA: ribulose-phosphate 3-epimerase [Dehalococcoidia bacterium]|nr:ribulose-phosphate 3-epimerase [Dehalococcoidia bacterium]